MWHGWRIATFIIRNEGTMLQVLSLCMVVGEGRLRLRDGHRRHQAAQVAGRGGREKDVEVVMLRGGRRALPPRFGLGVGVLFLRLS